MDKTLELDDRAEEEERAWRALAGQVGLDDHGQLGTKFPGTAIMGWFDHGQRLVLPDEPGSDLTVNLELVRSHRRSEMRWSEDSSEGLPILARIPGILQRLSQGTLREKGFNFITGC